MPDDKNSYWDDDKIINEGENSKIMVGKFETKEHIAGSIAGSAESTS